MQKVLLTALAIISALCQTYAQSQVPGLTAVELPERYFQLPQGMHLIWPIYPFNPYRGQPETEIGQAIGTLSIPLKAENQEFPFTPDVD